MSGLAGQSFFTSNATVLTRSGCGGEREKRIPRGAPASSGPLKVCLGDDGSVAAMRGEGMLAALPVAPSCAECAHGGGVATAFGGEVTAVAEHVRPAAHGPVILVRMSADLQACGNEPALVALPV